MPAECVFCAIVAGRIAAHVVLDTEDCLGFLDARPLFPGHTLVVPKAHHVTLPDLPRDLLSPYLAAVQRVAAALPDALDAEGTFVAENNVVSQSVPHLHFHVVPRRRKDGLRGFFWPRQKYGSDDEAAAVAARIRATIDAGSS